MWGSYTFDVQLLFAGRVGQRNHRVCPLSFRWQKWKSLSHTLVLTAGCPTCLAAAETETHTSANSFCWAVGGDTPVWKQWKKLLSLLPQTICFPTLAGWVCLSLAYASPKCLGCCEWCWAHPDSRDGAPSRAGRFWGGRYNALGLFLAPVWGWVPVGHQSSEQATAAVLGSSAVWNAF